MRYARLDDLHLSAHAFDAGAGFPDSAIRAISCLPCHRVPSLFAAGSDRVFEPNTTSKLDVHKNWVTVPAEAAAGSDHPHCGRNRADAVLHGSDRVHLRAHEHHHILTTVGYVQLGSASLVASIAP